MTIHARHLPFDPHRPPGRPPLRARLIRLLGVIGAVALVALIGAALWAWTPDRPLAELKARYAGAGTQYLDIAGTRLRVRDTGPREAPALLLLHGFGSSLETWEPWARVLEQRWRVVRLDLPGSGLSGPDRTGDYTDARGVELIGALLDRLALADVVLVGHSLGGRLAWRYAAAQPARVRRLVLISPDGFASPGFAYGQPAEVPTVLRLMRYFLPRALFRANLQAAYADPARLTDAVLERTYDLVLAPGNRAAMLERMSQTVLVDPLPLLRRIEAPTLLLWGEADAMIPFRNAADYHGALPHATLVALPDLGHVR